MQTFLKGCLGTCHWTESYPYVLHMTSNVFYFFMSSGMWCALNKGHFYTQAKSRDHETVRAEKKVLQGRPNTPPISCSVVTDPKV